MDMEDNKNVLDNQDIYIPMDVDTLGINQCCCEQSFSPKLSIDTQFQLEHTTVPILGEPSSKT